MGLLRSKEGLGHNFSPGLKRSGTLEGAERTQLTRSFPWSLHGLATRWRPGTIKHMPSLSKGLIFSMFRWHQMVATFISSLLSFPCLLLNRLCTWPADFWVPCSPWADRLQSLLAVLERRGVERREEGRGKERLAKGLEAAAVRKECLEHLMGLALWTQPPGTGFWENSLAWEIEPACPPQGTCLTSWKCEGRMGHRRGCCQLPGAWEGARRGQSSSWRWPWWQTQPWPAVALPRPRSGSRWSC